MHLLFHRVPALFKKKQTRRPLRTPAGSGLVRRARPILRRGGCCRSICLLLKFPCLVLYRRIRVWGVHTELSETCFELILRHMSECPEHRKQADLSELSVGRHVSPLVAYAAVQSATRKIVAAPGSASVFFLLHRHIATYLVAVKVSKGMRVNL